MSGYDLLRNVLRDRVIAFHPSLSRALGGVYEALLFQQLAYWSDKGDDPEWIYKTREELKEETTMNRYQQEQARATLRKLGVLQEERRGLPAKVYYRIVWDRVFELLEDDSPVGRRSTNKTVEPSQPVGSPSADSLVEDEPTSKSTAEITTEEEFSRLRKTTLEKYDDARLALLPYAEDLARELGDQAPLSSTTTRIVNIYKKSGLDLDTFIDRMMQARAITQERTSTIKTQSDSFAPKKKIHYWFSILEDMVS